MNPEAKKEAAAALQAEFRVSERRACRVVGIIRSTKRYTPRTDPLNEELTARLIYLSDKKKRFGAPRLHRLLLREGFNINHKRTARLYKAAGLSLKRKSGRKRYKSEQRAPLAQAIRPNQSWAMDFVSDQLISGGGFRGLTIVDLFFRENLVIEVGRSLPAVRVV